MQPSQFVDREAYFNAAVKFRLNEFSRQSAAIREGMARIIPINVVSLMTPKEVTATYFPNLSENLRQIDIAVCGVPEIDLQVLESHTSYSGVSKGDLAVRRFWKVLCPILAINSFRRHRSCKVSPMKIEGAVFLCSLALSTLQSRQFLEFVWGRTRLPGKDDSWSQNFSLSMQAGSKSFQKEFVVTNFNL